MRALERVVAVERRIVRGREARDEVRAQRAGRGGGERAADDLLHFAVVQVDAGPEERVSAGGC